jgi:hypothetical protein
MKELNGLGNAADSQYEYHIYQRYGLDADGYNEIFRKQGGKCAICETTEGRSRNGRLVVDHDHETGQVRGLLCGPCNSAIGRLGDTADRLLRAYHYLKPQPSIPRVVRVYVCDKRRKFLYLVHKCPRTGRIITKSAKTDDPKAARRIADEWELILNPQEKSA